MGRGAELISSEPGHDANLICAVLSMVVQSIDRECRYKRLMIHRGPRFLEFTQ